MLKNNIPQIIKQQIGFLKNSEDNICRHFISNPSPFLLSRTNPFTFFSIIFSPVPLFSLFCFHSSPSFLPWQPAPTLHSPIFFKVKKSGNLLLDTWIVWINGIEMAAGHFKKHTEFEFKNHYSKLLFIMMIFLCFFFSCLIFIFLISATDFSIPLESKLWGVGFILSQQV